MRIAFIILILTLGFHSANGDISCQNLFGQPFSSVAKHHGYTFLRHWTHFENAIEILADGKMEIPKNLPREKIRSYGYTPDQIMFYLTKETAPKAEGSYNKGMSVGDPKWAPGTTKDGVFTNLDQVYMLFSTEVLDSQNDYYISMYGQAYGQHSPESAFYNKNGTAQSLDKFLSGQVGEIGFFKAISANYLKEIWVTPFRRLELIGRLKAHGINRVGNIPIEHIIKSPPDTYNYIPANTLQIDHPWVRENFKWYIEPKK